MENYSENELNNVVQRTPDGYMTRNRLKQQQTSKLNQN